MGVVALNLIVLILNALHGLLSFYGRDYTVLNLDGLFGLRVIEGQLAHLYVGRYDDVPSEIMAELRAISANASRLANMALPHVYEDDPAYFKKFKYLVHRPWSVFKAHRFLEPALVWPSGERGAGGCAGEKESDECVAELMEAAASVAEDWAKDDRNADAFGCKRIGRACLERMMRKKGCSGYSLAHQLLYVTVAELVDCSVVLDEYANEIGYERGVSGFVDEFCANLHRELEAIASVSRSDRREGRLRVEARLQDLFLEMQFVCGQLGFVEFARREWLEAALDWQTPSGCYSNKDRYREPSIPGRRPLLEKDLADDCASHKSAVAAGALTIYLRLLIDPGPDEFRRLRIDAQPSLYDSAPLAGRFWTPPSRWTYARKEETLPPSPYPVRFRDATFFWFASIVLCFLYVTYRLCRRPNVRYMRWRGLKWR